MESAYCNFRDAIVIFGWLPQGMNQKEFILESLYEFVRVPQLSQQAGTAHFAGILQLQINRYKMENLKNKRKTAGKFTPNRGEGRAFAAINPLLIINKL